MEFKQLQSFVAVVDYGSFTRASEKLFISQPTISTHIRQLEEGHVDAVLIGETLMRQPDKKKALAVLRGSEETL